MNDKNNGYDEESRILDKSEVYDYEGETIDIGEPKKREYHCDYEQDQPSNPQIKIYQSNSSCLVILLVLLLAIIGLIFFVPLGLFILGVGIIGGIIKKIFSN